MLRKTVFLAVLAVLFLLASSTKAHAWGAYHVGFTHVGYGGVYHYGRTYVGGLGYRGLYGGYRYGYGGLYGAHYRYGYGGYYGTPAYGEGGYYGGYRLANQLRYGW
jgi:hypothetical protein